MSTPKIAIVTDSTADIPEDVCQELGIHVVRNLMFVDGKSLEDGIGLTREEFYSRLPLMKTQPTTGTVSAGVYQKLYSDIFHRGATEIVSIHAAGKLSGILNAVNSAAETFRGRVQVFDSDSVSLGLGLQALEAAEAALRGLNAAAVMERLSDIRPRVRVIALIDTLEYIRRSGRVSWAKARLGDLLNIKPFIELRAGVVHSQGETRTRRKGVERLLTMLQNLGPLERLGVLHSNAEAEAYTLLERLEVKLEHPVMVVNITPIIGTHVGPGALGFAAILQK